MFAFIPITARLVCALEWQDMQSTCSKLYAVRCALCSFFVNRVERFDT